MKSAKKVALFLPHLGRGGVSKQMLLLADAFNVNNTCVDILTFEENSTKACLSLISEGINVKTLKKEPYTGVIARLLRHYFSQLPLLFKPFICPLRPCKAQFYLKSLQQYLDHHNPDILYSAQPHCNIVAVIAKRLAGVETKLILTERTAISRDIESRMHKFRWRYIAAVMRRFYPEADSVISVSRCVQEDLAQLLAPMKANLGTIYNPIVVEHVRVNMSAPLTHPLTDHAEYKLVVASGRLVEQKNYPLLLHAFALASQERKLKLIILGEGGLKRSIQTLAQQLAVEDDLILPGHLLNPYPIMRQSDVFVTTSLWEGMPNVLLEAMACGCKTVALDCPCGPREILDHGKYGSLLPLATNARQLAEVILAEVERSHDESAQLQHLQKFSLENSIQQHIDLHDQLLASG